VPTLTAWAPAGPGPHAAVLLLHGAGGPGFFHEKKIMRPYPETLAARGYAVFMPHYFERGAGIDEAVKTARATIDWMTRQGDLRPGPVGAVGFSRGGFVACALASVEPRVGALVEVYGGLPGAYAARCSRMPPTLILHGDADDTVSVDEAHALDRLLARLGVEHEKVIYPGQEHGFVGEALDDSVRRTAGFFDARLRA
jgi:carboxymethylenebutenolidase